MRFSIVAAAIFGAASVSAIRVLSHVPRQFPTCATTCMGSADPGSCQVTDNHCLCLDSTFVNNVTSCIMSTCQGADVQTSLEGAQELCASVGVTLTSSAASGPTSSGGSAAPSSTQPSGSSAGASSPSTTPNAAITNTFSIAVGVAALGAAALAL